MERSADSFRFDVVYSNGESPTVTVTDADPVRGLSRVLEQCDWRPGRKITITPVWEDDGEMIAE